MSLDVAIERAALLGEGPRWDARTRRLLWVDIHGRELHVFDPATGIDRQIALDSMRGAAAPMADGRVLVGLYRFGITSAAPDGRVFVHDPGIAGPPAHVFQGPSTAPSDAEPTSAR